MGERTRIIYDDWGDELLNASKDAVECIIMSAYLNDYGAGLLLRMSRNIRQKSGSFPIKVLISEDFVPSKEDKIRILERLRDVEGIEVRLHCGERFLHAKSYVFRSGDAIKVMIGSNNLTSAGFSSNIETAILTRLREGDSESKKLISKFNEYWVGAKKVDLSEEGKKMLKDTPRFQKGDNVVNRTSHKVGTVNDVLTGAREIQYRVTFEGKKITISERDLDPFIDVEEKIKEDFVNGKFGNFEDYKLFHTWLRLALPLENNLYSYLGSKTVFNPYQFKPLLRFLSPNSDERLFIADEVGVGKTIETGIILTELLSRNRLNLSTPVIVVCPNSIMQKWQGEMKERFNLDFFIHESGKTLLSMLNGIHSDGIVPDQYRLSIVGLQLFRGDKYLSLLQETTENRKEPIFGLVVIDEAHHLRNVGTNSYDLGMTLSETTEMMLMLSATPLNLSNNDLFNQLHILNPSVFQDPTTFQNLQNPVRNINKIARLLYEYPKSKREITSAIMELMGDQIGAILLKREWMGTFLRRLKDDRKFDTQEAVKYERLFTALNPLYSSFTRTRKREAIEHQVKREARELPIRLSDQETEFQNQILEAIKEHFVEEGYDQSVLTLIMNTHRRMISSSIPAMRKYLTWALENQKIETDAPKGDEELTEDDSEYQTMDIDEDLRKRFRRLLQKSKDLEKSDSKYNQFKKLLGGMLNGESVKQVIVFSFFVHTLEYLKERLSADGYTVGIIHGQIPMISSGGTESREDTMKHFKEGKFQILLSSEVGGEGLDFQFCNAIVNYDLPYNPMKIEQRIGRIDRFGQKSDKIIIVNLFIAGTVDEEIYDRLYKRIRLVEDGVGGLEPIMGKEISEFQQALLTGGLSKEDLEERQHRIEVAIEHNKAEMQNFEDHRRELLNDDFLSKPINELGNSNFVKPEDAIQLTNLFLANDNGSSLLVKEENVGVLSLSKEVRGELEGFLRDKEGRRGFVELNPLLKNPSPVSVVFDGSSAEKFGEYVFLPPTGFWSKFITRKLIEEGNLKRVFKFKLICEKQDVPDKQSLICVFQVKFEGLRNQIELVAIPVDLDFESTFDKIDYEILPRALSACEGTDSDDSINISLFETLLDKAGENLSDFLEAKKKSMSEENSSLLNARITALERASEQRIQKNKQEIENHKGRMAAEGKEPDETYIRLTNAKIDKDRRLTNEKVQDLRQHQNLTPSSNLEGIILLSR